MTLEARMRLVATSVCVVVVGGVLLSAELAAAAEPAASPAPAVDVGCPKPEKDNSFALDTWMRRNKYPLSIKVIETEGKGGENVPVTLSVACGEGDYPAGKFCPMLAGKPVAAQLDVLATWPSDKSIKHALVTVVLPKLAAKETLTFTFDAAAPPAPGKFVPAADVKGLAFRTEFEGKDGAKTTTAIGAETLGQMAGILEGKITGDEAKKLAPRMCGPICYEFEVKVPARTGDADDKDIDVFYRLRLYTGIKGARVEYDVENTRIPAKPYPNPFTVTDREFAKLTFQAGPAGKPETVYEEGSIVHWFATRYRVCRWWGEKPLDPFAKENAAYLVYSEFFPKIDLDHPLTDAQVAGQVSGITKAKWYRAPGEFPDGAPLSNGPVHAFMGDYGGRPEIGCYPLWACLALASDSAALLHHARLWEGNALAAFPTHIRPPENGQPGASGKDPMRQLLYTMHHHPENTPSVRRIAIGPGCPTHGGGTSKGCPNNADTGHVPSPGYYTYLATGEKFYEEELSFWASAMLLGSDLFLTGHTRYTAWPLRNATDAAFVLPDDHPMKKYFAQMVQGSIDWQADAVKDLAKYWDCGVPLRVGGGWLCSGGAAMWQECFNIWALDNAARKGFPSAAPVREAEAQMLYRLFEGKEEFKAPDGKVYRWSNPQCMIAYITAINVARVDLSDPKHPAAPIIKGIVDNTGAMYYYTMLNEQYARQKVSPETLAVKLSKKVIEPEDLVLDPEFEKKWGESFSWYVLDINGNGPTSAALARYDNPRAVAMYEFVRELLDKKSNNRIRGIDPMR